MSIKATISRLVDSMDVSFDEKKKLMDEVERSSEDERKEILRQLRFQTKSFQTKG